MNVVIGNKSEEEKEEGNIGQEGEGDREVLNQVEDNLFRSISMLGKRLKHDVSIFLGNLNPNGLINQINELDEYFEYEDIREPNKVKFAKAKMKDHAKIWCKRFS